MRGLWMAGALLTAVVTLVWTLSALAAAPETKAPLSLPATGTTDGQFASFDRLLTSFLRKNPDVPGAAVAVARDGRLVYARGFGYADREKKEPVEPAALFRIASLSKPLTAVAVLQLVERGQLRLDDHVFDVLRLQAPSDSTVQFDKRWQRVTIRQLLQHTGGWDSAKKGGFDPMCCSPDIVAELRVAPPASPNATVQWMLRRPLDFEPSRKMVYSNFGYCLLGSVIEKVSGQDYETYVRQEVLAPLGIQSMKLGRTLLEERAVGEVKYYDSGEGLAVLGPHLGKPVPNPYGTFALETMAAHGGWIASAEDLVRFATAFDHPAKCQILKEKSIDALFVRPSGRAGYSSDGEPLDAYYGCGWLVRPTAVGSKRHIWHLGSLPGTSTLLVRRDDGLAWAVLFNARAGAKMGKIRQDPAAEIDPLMHEAADAYLRQVK